MRRSRTVSFTAAVALAATLGACSSFGSSGNAGGSGASGGPVSAAVAGIQWTTTLQPVGGSSIQGSASVAPGGSNTQTNATVTVTGSSSGSVHPWHLHRGSCSNDMGIVGPPDAYPMLGVSGDGSARIMVGLPFAKPTSGSYFVSVHRSAQDMTRIACGNLTMGTR